MRKLWIFGDSFSDEFTPPENVDSIDFRPRYVNYKGYVPKVFGQIIAEELGLEYENLAQPGECNDGIFQQICDVSDKIKDKDIIIINWSSINRFRIASKGNKWLRVIPNYKIDPKLIDNMDDNTIKQILLNRSSELYVSELNSKIKLIKNGFKNNLVINWTPFDNNYDSEKLLYDFETINEETNGVIDDGHYGEIGHIKLANYFLKTIRKTHI